MSLAKNCLHDDKWFLETNYLADFPDNSYFLLSSLQDRATEYIMHYIKPVYTNVCNLFKIPCNIIFLFNPKFIKWYFTIRLSDKNV